MELRLELIHRHLAGERLGELCREYGISLKTGKKFKDRFLRQGEHGLIDRSRAPLFIPHKTPPEIERILIAERKKRPTWGPRKLKVILEKRYKREFPAPSTIGDILAREGLVERRRHRSQFTPLPTHLRIAKAPNDIWCIDYKGQFRLGNGRYCYPLTMTDQFSRFIVGVEAMEAISGEGARSRCEELFREYGVPDAIRSDNGTPFASRGLAGLTKLSAYWMLLGIRLERTRPSHPEENGRHERMHLTLKQETTKPPSKNELHQQQRFDEFVDDFNNERPHEALQMKCPADVYKKSKRAYPASLPELAYPNHDDVVRVTKNGYVTLRRKLVFVSDALGYMHLGVNEETDGRLLLTFIDTDLGFVDTKLNRLTPLTP
jgi:transposase InsO family protein